MSFTLLVLAAGIGSRFGGLKQLAGLGPDGETLLEYSLHDARRAGCGRVIFVIRREMAELFGEKVLRRLPLDLEVRCVFQEVGDLPEGAPPVPASRTKPWGTAHAVWVARQELDGPFAVINADDYYGAAAYRSLAEFFARPTPAGDLQRFGLVGYRLGQTLSDHGAVSRGVCTVDPAGRLLAITEVHGIAPTASGPRSPMCPDLDLRAETTVSMNLFGLTPGFLPFLDAYWRDFLARSAADPKAECYLPGAVSAMIAAGQAEVEVLPCPDRWLGVTYPDDLPRVTEALRAILADSRYPRPLWARS